MCNLTNDEKCTTEFGTDSVVKFKNGTETFFFWGDVTKIDYALVCTDQSNAGEGETRIFVAPVSVNVPTADLELVTDDNTEDFPDDYAEGWAWWDGLEDNDEYIGPCWLEYLG